MIFGLALFAVFFVPAVVSAQTAFGPYFGGGSVSGYSGDALMSKSLDLANDLGAGAIRIYIGPKADIDYKDGTCIQNSRLANLAASDFRQFLSGLPRRFRQFLSDPQSSTVLITAYDWTSFGDCNTKNYLNPDFYTAENTAKIEKDYADFANYLKQFSSKKLLWIAGRHRSAII